MFLVEELLISDDAVLIMSFYFELSNKKKKQIGDRKFIFFLFFVNINIDIHFYFNYT